MFPWNRQAVLRAASAVTAGCLTCGTHSFAATASYDVTFSTSGQSMWQPGTAAFNFNRSYFIGAQWDAIPFDPPALNTSVATGFVSGQLNAGRVGLEAGLQATTESVSVAYPVKLSYTTPDKYTPGGKVSVGTAFAPISTATKKPSLSTLGPALSAKLDLIMDVSAAAGYGAHVAGFDPCTSGQAEDSIPNPVPQAIRDRHRTDFTLDTLYTNSFGLQGFQTFNHQLTIVPDPATFILLSLGAFFLGGVNRRRAIPDGRLIPAEVLCPGLSNVPFRTGESPHALELCASRAAIPRPQGQTCSACPQWFVDRLPTGVVLP